jgi:hypothetical protein
MQAACRDFRDNSQCFIAATAEMTGFEAGSAQKFRMKAAKIGAVEVAPALAGRRIGWTLGGGCWELGERLRRVRPQPTPVPKGD